MKTILCSVLLLGCSTTPPSDDVTGPFTGPIHRYVVDGFRLPQTASEARAFADDLDGDGHVDNQLGLAIESLAVFGDGTTHGPDMLAAGVVVSSVEIQADDLVEDPTVGVTYRGQDGVPAVVAGGAIVGGVFRSNRTLTTGAPGQAQLVLPVFADADPSSFRLDGLELDLTPDGLGGYDALLRGGVAPDVALAAAAPGLVQMIDAHPRDHLILQRDVDHDRDGTITLDEAAHSSLLQSMLTGDVTIAGRVMISAGLGVHLAACAEGSCTHGPAADPCHDRVRDGDETDVDCGGTCGACPGGAACAVAGDCQLGACDGGTCGAASCSDGILDGFESDVDCGGGCAPCGWAHRCVDDGDCTSHSCSVAPEGQLCS